MHPTTVTAILGKPGESQAVHRAWWQGCTLLLCSHLAGDAGDITVEPRPAAVALAAVQVVGLPALAPVFAGRGVTPAHQVLCRESKGGGQAQRSFCRMKPHPCIQGPLESSHYLAVEPSVSLGTGALVRPVAVLTRAPVQAGLGVTLVDVVLTVAAGEAGWTEAGEGVDAIHAGPPIEAGAGSTDTTSS